MNIAVQKKKRTVDSVENSGNVHEIQRTVPLSRAVLALEDNNEVRKFLRDLLTPQEMRSLEERWQIAQMLYAGKMSYRDIAGTLGASVTTVTRVARFLRDEPYQGYKCVLDRLSNE